MGDDPEPEVDRSAEADQLFQQVLDLGSQWCDVELQYLTVTASEDFEVITGFAVAPNLRELTTRIIQSATACRPLRVTPALVLRLLNPLRPEKTASPADDSATFLAFLARSWSGTSTVRDFAVKYGYHSMGYLSARSSCVLRALRDSREFLPNLQSLRVRVVTPTRPATRTGRDHPAKCDPEDHEVELDYEALVDALSVRWGNSKGDSNVLKVFSLTWLDREDYSPSEYIGEGISVCALPADTLERLSDPSGSKQSVPDLSSGQRCSGSAKYSNKSDYTSN
ncbi:hypothetical protein B0H11DRAFT_1917427 [Mycena galericulata]|nr:hypothetical protein B0H11DRAFT_1917427 [Mycena galericulata]